MFKINELKIKMENWSVAGRIVNLSKLIPYNDKKSNRYSFVLVDFTSEIKITSFNGNLFDQLENDKIIIINNGNITDLPVQYRDVNNPLQIIFSSLTTIERIELVENHQYPKYHLILIKIGDISNKIANSSVDVVGSIIEIQSIETTIRGSRKLHFKIADNTGVILCTLWDDRVNDVNNDCLNKKILIKAAKVSNFASRSLSITNNSIIEITKNEEQQIDLEKLNQLSSSTIKSNEKILSKIKEFDIKLNTHVQFEFEATIDNIKRDHYFACPECNNKLDLPDEGRLQYCKVDKIHIEPIKKFFYKLKLSQNETELEAACFDNKQFQTLREITIESKSLYNVVLKVKMSMNGNRSNLVIELKLCSNKYLMEPLNSQNSSLNDSGVSDNTQFSSNKDSPQESQNNSENNDKSGDSTLKHKLSDYTLNNVCNQNKKS